MLHIAEVLAVREVVASLSPLRQEICRLMAKGRTQVEVGEELGLSPQLVHYHVSCIREAFGRAGFDVETMSRKRGKHNGRRP